MHLSKRATRNRFVKNYDFVYPQMNAQFTVTAVAGHVMEHDFEAQYRAWNSCEPFALFDAPIEEKVSSNSKDIEQNLMQQARGADELMIWTDCDREGEHIGSEIKKICRKANPRIRVTRARFSAIIARCVSSFHVYLNVGRESLIRVSFLSSQIHHAAQNTVPLDQAQADAVDARIVLDLRIGAAFTRMQTLNLQRRLGQIVDAGTPVSYGPCQFPTLGFVVSRFEQVREFVPESFWYIYMSLSRPNAGGRTNEDETTVFNWRRNHLFEEIVVMALFDKLVQEPIARVTKKTSKPTKKWSVPLQCNTCVH